MIFSKTPYKNDGGEVNQTLPCILIFLLLAIVPPAAASVVQVTNDSAINSYPFWSPDGRYIVFTSYDDGAAALRVIERDREIREQATAHRSWEFAPFDPWSPDGKTLLFLSAEGDLWRMNPDGTGRVRLTEEGRVIPGLPLAGYGADWSADGKQIVYTSCLFENVALREALTATTAVNVSDLRKDADIWVMDADGGNKTRLTTGGDAWFPLWQPGGHLVAFLSTRSGNQEVWVTDRDGNAEQVTFSGGDVTEYVWSPDGGAIACVVASPPDAWPESSLWVVALNGSGAERLTSGNWDQSPVWSPDGARIAFRSMSRNQTALWVMKSGGGDLEPIISGDYIMHRWSPDSRGLAVSDGDDIYLVVPDSPATPGFEVAGTLATLCARSQAERIVTTKYSPKRTMASPLACTTRL